VRADERRPFLVTSIPQRQAADERRPFQLARSANLPARNDVQEGASQYDVRSTIILFIIFHAINCHKVLKLSFAGPCGGS
jgi:hypothetical protein